MTLYDPVEPDRYQEWRTDLSNDPLKALSTANDRDNDCLVFFSNTEQRLTPMKGTASGSTFTESTAPADQFEEFAFGWDRTEGVYFVQLTEEIRERLKSFLKTEFRHWNDALAECGAEYHSNWRDSPWSRAAVTLQNPPLGTAKPYFESKRLLESAMMAEVTEDKGGGRTAGATERAGPKLT